MPAATQVGDDDGDEHFGKNSDMYDRGGDSLRLH